MRTKSLCVVAAALAVGCLTLAPSTFAATTQRVSNEYAIVEVPTTTYGWQGASIDICPDSKWYLSVQGITNVAWTVDPINWNRFVSPGGEPARIPFNVTANNLLVPDAPVSALMARIGSEILYVGGGGAIPPVYENPPGPALSGALEFGYNDNNTQGNINSIVVFMYCYSGDCACTAAAAPTEDLGQFESRLHLDATSPNPVNAPTTFMFSVPRAGEYNAGIYDAQGRRIRDLFEGRFAQGSQPVGWDLEDNHGQRVAAGMYFCLLTGEKEEVSRKLVVVE